MSRSIAPGQPAQARFGSFDQAAYQELIDALGAGNAQVLTGSTDTISFPGTTILNAPGIDNCALAKPIAGPQPTGDDGKTVELIAASGFAHVITTPANGINGSKHILTWTAGAGNNVTLQAWNGSWYTTGTPNGVTIT